MDQQRLKERIAALDDKQAAHLVTQIVREVARKGQGLSLPALGPWAEQATASVGTPLQLPQNDWLGANFQGRDAGQVARTVLLGVAANPDCAPFIEAALAHYPPDEKADFGLLSIPIAIGLTHLLIAGDFDLDLGWFKFKKKGLDGAEQKEAITKVLGPVASAITKLFGANG
jgi:hypothetical protein